VSSNTSFKVSVFLFCTFLFVARPGDQIIDESSLKTLKVLSVDLDDLRQYL
jgi:hypothetical protein